MALERIDPGTCEERLVLDHYARYCFAAQFVAAKRVLDVACGTGYGSQLLRAAGAAAVVGVDIAAEAIDFARLHHSGDGLTFILGDAHRLSEMLAAERFDVIVSFETVEHLTDPALFLRECCRVAADDALMVLSVPNELHQPPDNPF